jgi:hypothetical protein
MSHAAEHPLFRERLVLKPSRSGGRPTAKSKTRTSTPARKTVAKKTPAE